MTRPDPRPLVGEPLALDLLNTRWKTENQDHDLLDSLDGLRVWLSGRGLAGRFTADGATRDALLDARAAIAACVDTPGSPAAAAALNDILERGRITPLLTAQGPGERTEFEVPSWELAWAAARDYLRLLDTAPDRIRQCAQPDCITHFLDTSRNGTRRWCSMAACGNRAKAARHYARSRHTADRP
ncbi:CGNR zinc finger domain-containing protein [Streptomyces nogalater]|uniref:CGNR zinc finger domain-containing protein n=1 Tax=Streptomyces nogalater TaxID=38314 RepID=A0ABW0WLS6_STRNO